MYTEDDLRTAVATGAISAEAADALRNSVRESREAPASDEEHFRLINSFNDIFVAIGAVIMLLAAGAIGQAIGGAIYAAPDWMSLPANATEAQYDAFRSQMMTAQGVAVGLAGLFVAGTAWGLAEFFTRKRRMAFPSILLLIAFVGGVFAVCLGPSLPLVDNGNRLGAILFSVSGVITAAAAWLHWRRFKVPITVAAGAGALAITAIGLLLAAVGPNNLEDPEALVFGLVFVAGLAIFAFAMRWDISDRERQTRRSDVAFWLHLLAAPMIAHPIFSMLGVLDGDGLGVGGALGVLAVYVLFGIVALAIDRRALLVSALAYVLIALTFLFEEFGAVELTFALTALVIGSALLLLSAFWTPIRNRVVAALPGNLQAKLPVAGHLAAPAAA